MSFEALRKTQPYVGVVQKPTLKLSIRRSGRDKKCRQFVFYLNNLLAWELKWKNGDQIRILFGFGEDSQTVKLEKIETCDPSTYTFSGWGGGGYGSLAPSLDKQTFSRLFKKSPTKIDCDWEIKNGCLFVVWEVL